MLFAVHLADQGLSWQTIKSYLAAVRHLYILWGSKVPGLDRPLPRLQLLLRGVKRLSSRVHPTTQARHLHLHSKGYFTSLNTLEWDESALCSLQNTLNVPPLVVPKNQNLKALQSTIMSKMLRQYLSLDIDLQSTKHTMNDHTAKLTWLAPKQNVTE